MVSEYRKVSEAKTRAPFGSPPLRFAFADPPYPQQSKRLYGGHKDYAGEVDHGDLLSRLGGYDGWALCTGAAMLRYVLPLCPEGTRVLSWVKPIVPYKPGVSVQYGWEPVLIYGGRRRHRTAPMIRDWAEVAPVKWRSAVTDAAASNSPDTPVIGMKPPAFCRWVFDCLGARADDTMDDLYPGSGGVGAAWAAYKAQPGLHDEHAPRPEQFSMEAA